MTNHNLCICLLLLISEPKLLVFTANQSIFIWQLYFIKNQNKYQTFLYITQKNYFAVSPVDEYYFDVSKIICMSYHWV